MKASVNANVDANMIAPSQSLEVLETKCTDGRKVLREGQRPFPPVWGSLQGRCKLSAGSGTELLLSEDFFCILEKLLQMASIPTLEMFYTSPSFIPA